MAQNAAQNPFQSQTVKLKTPHNVWQVGIQIIWYNVHCSYPFYKISPSHSLPLQSTHPPVHPRQYGQNSQHPSAHSEHLSVKELNKTGRKDSFKVESNTTHINMVNVHKKWLDENDIDDHLKCSFHCKSIFFFCSFQQGLVQHYAWCQIMFCVDILLVIPKKLVEICNTYWWIAIKVQVGQNGICNFFLCCLH